MPIMIGACKKKCTDCWDIPPYSNTYFKVMKNDTALHDSTLSRTMMYYISNTGQVVTNPNHSEISSPTSILDDTLFMYDVYNYYSDHPVEFNNSGIAMYYYPNLLSASAGVHNFYFKYPDGDIDTLYIKAEEVSKEQGTKERCYCTTPVRELKFNGKDVIEDTSIHLSNGQPVYIFEK